MNPIRVLDGDVERDARSGSTVAATRFLELFGASPTASTPATSVALGDALFVCATALELVPERITLASAILVERDDTSQSVGDVLAHGAVDVLSRWASGHPEGLVIVADVAPTPRASMAEVLRAGMDTSRAAAVRGVLTLAEGADVLFDLRPRARAGTIVAACRRDAARASLFEAVLQWEIVHPWDLVTDLSIGLARHVPDDDVRAQFELNLVRDIARRHRGLTAAIPWPDDELLAFYDRAQQLSIIAHAVQSVADGAWEEVPAYAARAQRMIDNETGAHAPEALAVLGAIGRALAATGHYEDARLVLRKALGGWLSIEPAQGSRALCELLRVAGVVGARDEVVSLRDREMATVMSALPDANSRAYVTLALGRALAQAGGQTEALVVLQQGDMAHSPHHVRTALQRWRAVAARATGDHVFLDEALAALDRLGESTQRELARLDGEDLDLASTVESLERLAALPGEGEEVRRLLERLAPGLSMRAIAERPDVLRQFLGEYRY